MRKNKGFTLVEILIVVVILGILAAIVIPQFSDASTQSRVSSAKSSLQTLRSQISLYKIQHLDAVPTSEATFVAQMTGVTDSAGTVSATGIYGPYLQAMPTNPFNDLNTIGLEAARATVGWVYDPSTGDITLGGGSYTDLDGDGTEDTDETHANW